MFLLLHDMYREEKVYHHTTVKSNFDEANIYRGQPETVHSSHVVNIYRGQVKTVHSSHEVNIYPVREIEHIDLAQEKEKWKIDLEPKERHRPEQPYSRDDCCYHHDTASMRDEVLSNAL